MSETLGVLVVLATASSVAAQSEDLMGRQITRALERSILDVEPFHLRPSLDVNYGYDSNAILTGQIANPDVAFRATPSIEAALPIRGRVLLDIYEELGFIYYRKLSNLRNLANVTRVGGTIGGTSLLARVGSEFRSEQVRPSREVDIPVDQRTNRLTSSLTYTLGFRTEASFDFDRYRVRVEESDFESGGVSLKSRLDRVENLYTFNLTRHVSRETLFYVEYFFGRQAFDDASVGRDAREQGGRFGFEFSPSGNLRGTASLGIERLVPDSPVQPGFEGLVGDVDTRVRLGDRFSLRGLFTREVQPSVFQDTLFVISSRAGLALDVYFGELFFVRPGFALGSNNYPESFENEIEDPAGRVSIRGYEEISVSFNYRVSPTWLFSVGSVFTRRDTFTPGAVEDRTIVNFGIRSTY